MTDTLTKLYDAAQSKRWHNKPKAAKQNLAEHSFGLALIVSILHPAPSANLLKACLWHDLHESKFGDFPHDTKNLYPELRKIEQNFANSFWAELDIQFPELTAPEKIWLELADQLDVCLFLTSHGNPLNDHELYEVALRSDAIVQQKARELQAFGFFQNSEGLTVH